MPEHYNTPYFRVKLYTDPSEQTGISQHETLLRLQNITNATVSYACPMFFDIQEIYDNPDIERVKMVWPMKTMNTLHNL